MRIAVVGASAVAGLVFAATVAALVPNVGFAQRPAQSASSGGPLITLTSQVNEHKQQVTVIDQDTHTMAVYHIDGTNGACCGASLGLAHWRRNPSGKSSVMWDLFQAFFPWNTTVASGPNS